MDTKTGYFVSLLAILAGSSLSVSAAADGLQNLGFESGLSGWQVTENADAVLVVGSEGPSDSPVYADKRITVDPFIGESMLRLGTFKEISQNQQRGGNSVSQTFSSHSDTLLFSVRLFSWEHRGDDRFSFNLRDASGSSYPVTDENGGPLVITMPDRTTRSCSQTPCEMDIDVGKRNRFLD